MSLDKYPAFRRFLMCPSVTEETIHLPPPPDMASGWPPPLGRRTSQSFGRYLAKEIAHRLPAKGQIVPSPKPTERMVFIPHFVRGLGFPLHPFVRGLMFYYGLDFHDLAPNSFLNISTFIVVCEAFLCIQPHFGLWLKIFNVKPKVVDG